MLVLNRLDSESCDYTLALHVGRLHVINVAGVGHLLNVDARLLLGASDGSDDSMLDHVLQVRKSTPDISKVLEGVCPGTGVPIAAKQNEK